MRSNVFEPFLHCPNAGPNLRFGSEDSLNLEPNAARTGPKFGVLDQFGTELRQHYLYH